MQKRQTNRWVCVPLLGLLGAAAASCSAPSQFVLELGADGGAVDVPLQFVPDRGLVDVALADVVMADAADGQVVDVARGDVQLADVVPADAADGGALDAGDAVVVDVAQLDAMPGDVVDVQLADVVPADVADGGALDRPDVVDVPAVDTPPAPCRRNADCTGGWVCGFHDSDAGGTQVCEPPHGPQEGEACVRDRDCQSGFCLGDDIGCGRPCVATGDCEGLRLMRDAGPLRCIPRRLVGSAMTCAP